MSEETPNPYRAPWKAERVDERTCPEPHYLILNCDEKVIGTCLDDPEILRLILTAPGLPENGAACGHCGGSGAVADIPTGYALPPFGAKPCDACGGAGSFLHGGYPGLCEFCNGTGKRSPRPESAPAMMTCPGCSAFDEFGANQFPGEGHPDCPQCGGSGEVPA